MRTHVTGITALRGALVLAAIGVASILLAPLAAAKDMPADMANLSLEELMEVEVVYGASKYEQKTAQAPSSVTIVGSEEIARYGWRTLAELLRSARGFYTTYDRNYTFLGARGFSRPGDYNSRVLLLVDGHRLNDNVYDAGFVGTEALLDLDVIDRVEIIRGPSSSIYGTSAFFAVINIVTRRAKDGPGLCLAGSAGSYDAYDGVARIAAAPGGRWDLLVSASRLDRRGQDLYFPEFDSPATNNGLAVGADRDQATRFFASVSRGPFRLQTGYVDRRKEIPTASFGTTFNDPRNQTTDMRSYVDLRFEQPVFGSGSFSSRVYFDRYWYAGTYNYDSPTPLQERDYADGQCWGQETQLAVRAPGRQRVVVGSEFRRNFRTAQGVWDVEPRYVYFDRNVPTNIWALFAQDEIELLRRVTLSGGLRYDRYESFGGTLNPRAAVIVSADPATTVKLLFGQAFRAPNAYELYYLDAITQKTNPNLKPEVIRTYETVVEHRLGETLRASVSGFYYDLDGLAAFVLDPTDSLNWFVNQGDIHGNGVEAEIEGRTRSGWIGRGSYAYQYTRDVTGPELSNSPRHLMKLNISAPMMGGKIFLGTEVQYVGTRRTARGGRAADYVFTNFTLLERSWWKRVELSATLYNALDRRYGHPGSEEHAQDLIPQDGRNARLRISYSF